MAIRKELTLTPSALAMADVEAAAAYAAAETLAATGAVSSTTSDTSATSTESTKVHTRNKKTSKTRTTTKTRTTKDVHREGDDDGDVAEKKKGKKTSKKKSKDAQADVTVAASELNPNAESTTDASAETAKDMFGNDSRWSDLLSIKGDRVVNFTIEKFSAKTTDYPGYALAIKSSVGSMRLVIVQRIISEILFYFGGFSKMQSFLGKLKGKSSSKTESSSFMLCLPSFLPSFLPTN
jgi:hypothetical protein